MKTCTFREQFIEAVLEFLWGQWATVGVAGHGSGEDDRLIDPEALLLLTTSFGRHEPRLFDEVLDWLQHEADTLNLQRLKNFHGAHRLGDPGVLAAVADLLGSQTAHQKWRQLAGEVIQPGGESEGLFYDVPTVQELDPSFLRYGLKRDAVQLRGLSSAPDPRRASNLIFKLRALFGLQARVEILACLLCSEVGRPADIASLTGYFPRTVQLTLNEMTRSGHVSSARNGREKHFWLQREEWLFLANWPGCKFPRWINWPPLFAMLEAVGRTVRGPGFEAASAALQAIALRNVLVDTGPALLRSGLPAPLHTSPELSGAALLDSLLEDFRRLLGT